MNKQLKVIPGMYWFAATGPDGETCGACAHSFNTSSPIAMRRRCTTKVFCALVCKTRKNPPKLDKFTPALSVLGGEDMSDRLLRLHQVLEIIDVVPSTIYRWMGKGSFPAQIRVSPGCVAWRESDIRAWTESLQLGGKEADSARN